MYGLSEASGGRESRCVEEGQEELRNEGQTAVRQASGRVRPSRPDPPSSSRPPKRHASLRASQRLKEYVQDICENVRENVGESEESGRSRGRAVWRSPFPPVFHSRLAAISFVNSREGKNVMAHPMSVWLTGAVGQALASHAATLSREDLSEEQRLKVGQTVLDNVVELMKTARPSFWKAAKRKKTDKSKIKQVRRTVRKMVGGFLRVRLATRVSSAEVFIPGPRFYVDYIPGFGLGLRLRPVKSFQWSGRLLELTESSWLSHERPRHVSHRSVVKKENGTFELVGLAALLNAGCSAHVMINPGEDFVSFRAVEASDLVPHKHVLMSYGMSYEMEKVPLEVPLACWCGEPIL